MSVTPSMSPASSREKGSGTAMDWSRFSTPSRVRSPVLGGVTASRTGPFLPSSFPNRMFFGFSFNALLLSLTDALYVPVVALSTGGGKGRCPCWPGLHSMTAVSSGVASMRTGKRLPFASSNPSPRGHDRSQR